MCHCIAITLVEVGDGPYIRYKGSLQMDTICEISSTVMVNL